jgi:hypothetical protein
LRENSYRFSKNKKPKQTQKMGLTVKKLFRSAYLLSFLFAVFGASLLVGGKTVVAATNSTLNFQARLLSNTGTLIADGQYNMQFDLYSVVGGGTSLWTEDRLVVNAQGVTVKDGYFSVRLGELDAFPTTINWDQEHWLGLTVRGASSCAWASCLPTDSEMTPRFKLTSVPYAFRSGAVVDTAGNAFTGDDLLQKAPSTIQAVNAAVAALRVNQAGSGGLLQLQGDGVDVVTVAKTGNITTSGSLTVLGATTTIGSSSQSGSLVLNDGDGNTLTLQTGNLSSNLVLALPTADGTADQCLKTNGSGALSFGDCGSAGGAAVGKTVVKASNEVQNSGVNPAANLQDDDELFFSIGSNETWTFRFVVQANANVTPDIKFAVTAPTGAVCTVGVTNVEDTVGVSNLGCGVSSGIMNGTSANEVYEIIGTVVNGVTAGNVTLQWAQNTASVANVTVYSGSYVFASSDGSALTTFNQGGNDFGATAVLGTTSAYGLEIITNNSTAISISSAGAASFNSQLTVINGGIDVTGDGLVNVGVLSGVSSVSGSSALSISSGGSGNLSLTSSSGTIVLGSGTLRRNAAGSTTIDLNDASAATSLSIVNTDTSQVANLSVEGSVSALSFAGSGANLTALEAGDISTGVLSDARLSTNVVLLNGGQSFTVAPTFGDGLILANSTNTTAGALRWSGTDFEGYDGVQWVSLTGGGSESGAAQSVTVVKSASEIQNSTVNPSASLQDDDELLFSIGSNETWSFTMELQLNSPTAPDIKFAVTAPSGATCSIAFSDEENAVSNSNLGCGVSTGLIATNGTNELYRVTGSVTNGSTAGDVVLQWAQNTANAANTTIFAGSTLVASSGDQPAPGTEYVQGGNAFGATAVIGSTDAQDLNLIANNTTVVSLTSSGEAIITGLMRTNGGLVVGNSVSDTFEITSGSVTLTNGLNFDSNTLVIDSATNRVGLGNASPANKLSINTPSTSDAVAEVLIYTNTATSKGLVVQGAPSQTANLAEFQTSSGSVVAGVNASGQLVLGASTSSNGTAIFNNSSNTNTKTLSVGTASSSVSIQLPDASGILCLSNSDDCGYIRFAAGSVQSDASNNDVIAVNKTSTTGNLIELQRTGSSVFRVSNGGALQIQTTSTVALDVRTSGGSSSLFSVDTSGNIVRVGSSTGDGTGVLFVVDSKNTAGDPTGLNGALYYNSDYAKFRCFENGTWRNCLSAGNVEHTFAAGLITWTNMPVAETEFTGTQYRVLADLTHASEFRFNISRIAGTVTAGADCRVQYATTYGGTYANLDGATGPEVDVSGVAELKTSGWVDVTAAAKTEVYLRVLCKEGNGANDPQFRNVAIQIR